MNAVEDLVHQASRTGRERACGRGSCSWWNTVLLLGYIYRVVPNKRAVRECEDLGARLLVLKRGPIQVLSL